MIQMKRLILFRILGQCRKFGVDSQLTLFPIFLELLLLWFDLAD